MLTGSLALSFGCGGGNGDGSPSSSTATVTGNLSNVSTTAVERESESWLAWVGTEIVGFARTAWAQVANTDLEGISILADGEGTSGSDVTDPNGDFDVTSPTGNVTVTFSRGNCTGTVSLPDVVDDSVIDLQNVSFDCGGASPGRIAESFEGVVVNKPGSPQGNLVVCVESGASNRIRAVMISGATFGNGSFEDLAVGDRVGVAGERVGQGAPSALDADTVDILASDQANPCGGEPEPTPTPEPTPEPTPAT